MKLVMNGLMISGLNSLSRKESVLVSACGVIRARIRRKSGIYGFQIYMIPRKHSIVATYVVQNPYFLTTRLIDDHCNIAIQKRFQRLVNLFTPEIFCSPYHSLATFS